MFARPSSPRPLTHLGRMTALPSRTTCRTISAPRERGAGMPPLGGGSRLLVMLDEQGVETKAPAAVAVVRHRTNGRLVRSDESAPPPAPVPGRAPVPASAAVGTPGRPVDETADFLKRLARSMQAVARAQRTRIAAEVDLRRVARLAELRDGRRAEALRLRQLAAENRRAIDAWAESAKRRITNERERRKAELESDLKRSLREENRRVARRVKDFEAVI